MNTPCGLSNIHGHSCFMNTVIQCLSSTSISYTGEGNKVVLELNRLVRALLYSDNDKYDVVFPQTFYNVISSKSKFGNRRQHDAHEFLMYILNALDDNMSSFVGEMSTSVVCMICGDEKKSTEIYTTLILPLVIDDMPSLENSIEEFQTSEMISERECPSCKKKTLAKKKTTITKIPKILILVFLRFRNGKKDCRPIEFYHSFFSDSTYHAIAICSHTGSSLEHGHYYAHVKRDSNWYLCDDELTKHEVPNMISKDAYMVFYERQ